MNRYGSTNYPELMKVAVERIKKIPYWTLVDAEGKRIEGYVTLALVEDRVIELDGTNLVAKLLPRLNGSNFYSLETQYSLFAETLAPTEMAVEFSGSWDKVRVTKDALVFDRGGRVKYESFLAFMDKCLKFAKRAQLSTETLKNEL